MELSRELFEPVIDEALEMNDLEAEVVLSFLTEKGRKTIPTCPGDVYKIVNMLMDYARLLEIVVEQWGLQGFHRATYEVHAEKCRQIAQKYAQGIGYDYEKAMEKCQKRQGKKCRDDGVGEDALVLTLKKVAAETPSPDAEGDGADEAPEDSEEVTLN